MLHILATIKKPCPEGANLAEQTKVGEKKMETAYGPKKEPIFECVAVGGTPFSGLDEVNAPIALKTGDEIAVDQATGYVITVKRDGVVVYPPASPKAEKGKA